MAVIVLERKTAKVHQIKLAEYENPSRSLSISVCNRGGYVLMLYSRLFLDSLENKTKKVPHNFSHFLHTTQKDVQRAIM